MPNVESFVVDRCISFKFVICPKRFSSSMFCLRKTEQFKLFPTAQLPASK